MTTGSQNKLLSISAATIDRLPNPVRLKYWRKGLGVTKPGSLLKNQIPIRTHYWDVSQSGFMETYTLAGDIVWSLTMTDIHITWTENRSSWNKGAQGVLAQIQDIVAKPPFAPHIYPSVDKKHRKSQQLRWLLDVTGHHCISEW